MTRDQKRTLYIAIGILISVVLLVALFRNVNFAELAHALESANYWWLIPYVALIVASMYQRAYRWRFMLDPIKRVEFRNLLAATCIGFMANNVLPLRLGEFVRAYSLAEQDHGVSKSASLATIFVERMVFDLIALLVVFGTVLASSHLAIEEGMKEGTYIAIGIAALGAFFVLWVALRPRQIGRALTRALFFAPESVRQRVETTVIKFSRGLEFITNVKALLWVLAQTLIIWIVMGFSNWFVLQAFDLHLPISASFVLLVVVSIAILVPSSPGFVGVYHAGTVWTLSRYGVGKEQALSFALVLHAAQYIPITLMGFYYLRKEHLSLKKLEEEAVEEEPQAVP